MSTPVTQEPKAQPSEQKKASTSGDKRRDSLLGAIAELPGVVMRRVRRSLETTPGRLSFALAGIVVLSLLLAIIGTVMVADKQAQVDDLMMHREPVVAAAQDLNRDLLDAESKAGATFLTHDEQSNTSHELYLRDLNQVGSSLAATVGESNAANQGPNEKISSTLPGYAALLETAAANNRQGYPVGASYLLSASNVLRGDMLPASQQLFDTETGKFTDEIDDSMSFPWFTLLVVAGLVALLIWVQRFLRHRTNRQFNRGLVFASAAVVVLIVWSLVALVFSTVNMSYAQTKGAEVSARMATIRLYVVQARADEILQLAAGNDERYEKDSAKMRELMLGNDDKSGAFGSASAEAPSDDMKKEIDGIRDQVRSWFDVHRQIVDLNETGKSTQAIDRVLSLQTDGANAKFTTIERRLVALFDSGRKNFLHDASAARNSLIMLDIGFFVLSIAAAVGGAVGIWQRLREYR